MQLFGENGILNNASKAKISHEDESAKEELQLAWSARMSKFYEDVSSGKAKTSDIYKYFTEDELNTMLGNNGKVHALTYDFDKNSFSINYISNSGIPYIGEVKKSGEIVKLERAEGLITEVWASYYASLETMTYASSKDIKLDGQEPTEQWNISEKIEWTTEVPWAKNAWNKNEETGQYSLDNSKLKKITKVQILDKIIPKQTDYMFAYIADCDNFEGMENINYSYCREIGNYEFLSCRNISNINIPSEVKKIGCFAFQYCTNLKNINLNNNITSLSHGAFEFTGLEEITIPENIGYIGMCCFSECNNLTRVNYNAIDANIDVMTFDDGLFGELFRNVNEIVIGENVKKINEYTFIFSNIEEIVIPDNVESISDYAFYECLNLKKVDIGTGLTKIGKAAFMSDDNLTTVTGGENIQEIGASAFGKCLALSSFEFSNNLKEIDKWAFSFTSLKKVTIPQNMQNIGLYSFARCPNLTLINYNAIDASESNFFDENNYVAPPFFGCNENLTVNIGSDVKVLPNYLFMSSNIKQINIEEGLEKIGKQTFYNCSNLESATIPTTVTEIGNYSFNKCSNLATINYNAIDASKSDFSYYDSATRKLEG